MPSTESRSNDRTQETSNAHYHRQDEYAVTPPASPTRYRDRERARSLSPNLEPEAAYSRSRDRESRTGRNSQRPGRGRIATNTDSPIQHREREHPSAGPDYPERHWGRPPPVPPTEYTSKNDRSTRRPPRQRQQGDDTSFEHLADDRDRAPLRRSASNRVSNRDREPETREHLVQNPSIPTSSTLSASSHPHSPHLSYPYTAAWFAPLHLRFLKSLVEAVCQLCYLYPLRVPRLLPPPFRLKDPYHGLLFFLSVFSLVSLSTHLSPFLIHVCCFPILQDTDPLLRICVIAMSHRTILRGSVNKK